jgi:trans-aconitate methyltransferase
VTVLATSIRYVTDVPYIANFTPELAPACLDLVAAINGFRPPDHGGAFTWCELGCGMGLAPIIFAATHRQGVFHGIDAISAQIDRAREIAAMAEIPNLTFHALDFAAASDLDLPEFDYIVAHGVYAWIDEQAAASFRRFIDRHLAPGGLVYVSYNSMPGWAADAPFQHLAYAMAAHEQGNSIERFAAVAATIQDLHNAGAAALIASPIVSDLKERLAQHPAAYFAHEYLAPAWRPLYVDEVRKAMAEIGLAPIGSATFRDNFDSFVLRQAARDAIASIADADLKELTRDYFMHQRFRRDVYGRMPERIDDDARNAALLDTHFALKRPAGLTEFFMYTEAGRVAFDNPVARRIVSTLAEGARPLAECGIPGGSDQDLIANGLALCAAVMIIPVSADRADVRLVNAALFQSTDAQSETAFHVLPYGTSLRLDNAILTAFRGGRKVSEQQQPWVDFIKTLG